MAVIVRALRHPLAFDYSLITNHNSVLPSAGVVQWQNGSFPSCTRGFDSLHPLIRLLPRKKT